MKNIQFLLFVCLLAILYVNNVSSQLNLSQPQVTLDLGTLRGFYQTSNGGRPIASFQSIPYVKQPMARHRFKDSIEMNPWLGVYDATGEAPDCLQLPPSVLGPLTGSEDCLYINVYTPYVPSGTEIKPLLDVLVYIHGGGFMYYGSKYFTPKYLLDKDLVLVTFNYRLGPLGFLSVDDLTMPGNGGMKDQVMALRWVQRYISLFGGDPSKVTLAGHSAGGASVHYHLLSPLSKGLFHKAIISSGTVLNPWAKAEKLKQKTISLSAKLGCAFQDANLMIKCLRSRPANHIVAYSQQLMPWKNMPMAPWAPTVEPLNPTLINPPGTPLPFLEDDPMSIITSGQAHDIPIMFSYIPLEGSIPAAFFAFDDAARLELSTKWNELLPHILDYYYTADVSNFSQISDQIKQQYLNGIDITDKISSVEHITKMIGDRLYVSGISESSKLHATVSTSPVYMFRFSYKSISFDLNWVCNCTDNLPGAVHYDDAGFLIDNTFPTLTSALDLEVRNRLIDLWYTFIIGKPKYANTQVPEVKPGLPSLTFLDIGYDGNPSIQTESDPGQLSFWKSLPINDRHPQPTIKNVHNEL